MNKRLRKKKGFVKPSINERVAAIAIVCIENDLRFEYAPKIRQIEIRNEHVEVVTRGYIDNWKFETPEQVLTRIEREVKEYVDGN